MPAGLDAMLGHRCRTAFSLLELVIVLVVMIGLMAIVWPNLQRPLSRTSLDEAAQMVRSAIDESRYQAALAGTPWFVKLQLDARVVSAGTFEAFMESTDDAPPLGNNPRSAPIPADIALAAIGTDVGPRKTALRSWQLPDGVTIADVHWNLSDATQREDPSNDPGAQDRWLPMLASGRGRDATIVLWDHNSQQSVQVVFISSTGAIEVLR